MNGYTSAGKTTVAKKIASFMGIELISSWKEREKVFSRHKILPSDFYMSNPEYFRTSETVYESMAMSAEKLLKKNKPAIIDGAFLIRKMREKIYTLAQKLNIQVYVVQCLCSNESIAKERIEQRINDKGRPYVERARDRKVYLFSKEYSDPLDEDVLPGGNKPKIIKYDTNANNVSINFNGDSISQSIIKSLIEG